MDLILASTSAYRKTLLARLPLEFRCVDPQVDESATVDETAPDLARRLALAKARSVSLQFPEAIVIGSDQVAARGNELLGKPGNKQSALAQLQASSGREVTFHTAVALVSACERFEQSHVEPVQVRFRHLSAREIERYLSIDQPWDCAGSFKVEQLGIALFEAVRGNDPTSLEGLPLIALCRLLREAGISVP